MPRIPHWFDFETFITAGQSKPMLVKVEATISSDNDGVVEIEGVKVYWIDDDGEVSNTELVLSDTQMNEVCTEIYERCDVGEGYDEQGDDWRNEWE